jgi:hypothetical protein
MKNSLHIGNEFEGFLQIPLGGKELLPRELQNRPPIG